MNYCWKITSDLNNSIKQCVDENGAVVDNSNCENCNDCRNEIVLDRVECRKITVGYDNGITPGSSFWNCPQRQNFIRFNLEFEVISWEVNGQLYGAGETIGPFTTWAPQLQGWADFFNKFNPNTCANATFRSKPSPTWRYTEIEDCNPRAVYGPLIMRNKADGCIVTVYPVINSSVIEKLGRYDELDCKTDEITTTYLDRDNKEVNPTCCPDCYVPCGFNFGDYIAGGGECVSETYNLCGFDDPDNLVPVIRVITDCGTVRSVETYTEDSYLNAQSPDDLVEYLGEVRYCDGSDFVIPPIKEEVTLEDFKVTCVDGDLIPDANYEGAIQITTGRPDNSVVWELIDNRDFNNQVVIVSGNTFSEFSTALAAAGYSEFIEGELHYICPCPPGLVNQGDYFVQANGNTVTKPACTPLGDLPNSPKNLTSTEEQCALQTLGCLDEQILAALTELSTKSNTHLIEGCVAGKASYSIVDDLGLLVSGPFPLSQAGLSECCSDLWLLLSKCPPNSTNQCDLNSQFPGIIYMADIPTGSGAVHPSGAQAGQAINGWYAYAICSDTQPVDDGNGHYWIQGSVNDYTIAGINITGTEPSC